MFRNTDEEPYFKKNASKYQRDNSEELINMLIEHPSLDLIKAKSSKYKALNQPQDSSFHLAMLLEDYKAFALISQYLSFEEDLEAIRELFRNKAAILELLKKLEVALEAQAGKRYNPTTKQMQGYVPGKPYPHKKLFSNYAKEWAKKHDFQFTSLVGFNSAAEFASVLIAGSLFKDTVFRGTIHGQWTHFIQWWCIVEANKKRKFLHADPAILYKMIGLKEYLAKDLKNPEKSSIWYKVFEISSQKQDEGKLSQGVIALNTFLKSTECGELFPVLHQLITGRESKGTIKEDFLTDSKIEAVYLDYFKLAKDYIIKNKSQYENFITAELKPFNIKR